jgi:hypothetical protein
MYLGQPELLAARQHTLKFLQVCFYGEENTGVAICPVRLSTSSYHIPKYLINIDKFCCGNRRVNVRVKFYFIKDSLFYGRLQLTFAVYTFTKTPTLHMYACLPGGPSAQELQISTATAYMRVLL